MLIERFCFYDTETTGLAAGRDVIMELASIITDENGNELDVFETLIRPEPTWPECHPKAFEAHGITKEMCMETGIPIHDALDQWEALIRKHECGVFLAHNLDYDSRMLRAARSSHAALGGAQYCTMKNTTYICNIPNKWGSGIKWPNAQELYAFCHDGKQFENAHRALSDIRATKDSFFVLKNKGLINV